MNRQGEIRFGILGTAGIARAALIQPARTIRNVSVFTVASRDSARAARFAQKHGIPRVHNRYDELISDEKVDAVYVPLPNSLHAEWSLRALDAGKHVLCEKPMAANADQAQQIAQRAAETQKVVCEAVHYRYHPLATRMKSVVESGQLGTLRHIEAQLCILFFSRNNFRFQYAMAGGATMDLGCYAVNLVRFLTGDEPEVTSARASLAGDQIDRSMEAELEFPNGCTGRIFCSLFSTALFRSNVVVQGDRGELRVSNPYMPHLFYHRLRLRTRKERRSEKVPGGTTFEYQLNAFADAVRGSGKVPTDAADAVKNMRVVDAIYEKAGLKRRGQ